MYVEFTVNTIDATTVNSIDNVNTDTNSTANNI